MEQYFESHAHYDDESFNDDREQLLSSLPDFSVGIVVNAGADIDSSRKGIELSRRYGFFYTAVGVHPHEVKNLKDSDEEVLRELCNNKKLVAVGEIGLDYYYDYSPRDVQAHWFKRQIDIAADKGLPIIIHSRDAAEDTFNIIKNSRAVSVGGVVHCYSGSYEMAAEYIKLGFYIGIGGVVTYKNAKKLVEVAKKIPLDRLLIETDCPYLSPEPKRGKRNDSKNLSIITDKIAEIRGISPLEVMRAAYENGMRLFKPPRNENE